jgi:hypothetical protein
VGQLLLDLHGSAAKSRSTCSEHAAHDTADAVIVAVAVVVGLDFLCRLLIVEADLMALEIWSRCLAVNRVLQGLGRDLSINDSDVLIDA